MRLNYQYIKARDLGDAWFQTLFRMLEEGSVFKIDRGSFAGQKRLEFDYVTIQVEHPGTKPLLPQIESHFSIPNPVADDYLDEYLPYLMTGELKKGESYTYGQRLCAYPDTKYPMHIAYAPTWKDILIQDNEPIKNESIYFINPNDSNEWCLNQIELLIWTYKNKGYRNNQMVLQVAHPTDMLLKDPPCLRHIDTRIQDGKLHFYPYFRSWDLWGGFPANLGGIQLLKEYVAAEIGVEDGEIIASSKGLHIYDYSFDLAKCLRMRDDMALKGE
ncbi:MAG: thymidylate synthase [Candidatus Heimdallarchaeaceae archaeon]